MKRISREKYLSTLACMSIVGATIIEFFNRSLRAIIILPLKLDTLFLYSIFLIIIFMSLGLILTRIKMSSSLVIIFIFISINLLISFIMNNQYKSVIGPIGFNFLFMCLPWFFVGFSIRDYKTLKSILYYSAIFSLLAYIVFYFIMGVNPLKTSTYSQSASYILLFPALVFSDFKDFKSRPYNILLFILTTIFMISFGARGPVISLLLFIMLNLTIYLKDMNLQKKIFIFSGLIIVFVLFFININFAINGLYKIFINLNLSTRVLDDILKGDFFTDVARMTLIKTSINLIKQSPLFGTGIGVDRILLSKNIGVHNILSDAGGWYPHNIFIELMLHFGVVIGAYLIFMMLKVFLTTVFKNSDSNSVSVILLYVGVGFLPLLFSGSYINTPLFFMLLGLSYNKYREIMVSL